MAIDLRNAEKKDVMCCVELINKTGLTMPTTEEYTASWQESHLNDNLFIVTENDGAIIGFILGEKLKFNGAMLWYVVVDPAFWHNGIGTELLKAFEQRCKKMNIEWIIGYSETASKTLKFYKDKNYDVGKNYVEIFKSI